MESHYCRATFQCKYLDSTVSISKMYEPYIQDCKEKNLMVIILYVVQYIENYFVSNII